MDSFSDNDVIHFIPESFKSKQAVFLLDILFFFNRAYMKEISVVLISIHQWKYFYSTADCFHSENSYSSKLISFANC